jgi:hypothetical protein
MKLDVADLIALVPDPKVGDTSRIEDVVDVEAGKCFSP